jgi:hypothetical protein
MGLPTFEWIGGRSPLTSTSAANPSAAADSSLGGDHMKQRILFASSAHCGTTALRSRVSGVEAAGPPELPPVQFGAVRCSSVQSGDRACTLTAGRLYFVARFARP